MGDLSHPIFRDEKKARAWLEAQRWPNGPVCAHCRHINQATLIKGKSHRKGLYQCSRCQEPFTVTIGTLYESSHVPLNKWLTATYLLVASNQRISALRIGHLLGLSKKTAWFLCDRIYQSLEEGGAEDWWSGTARRKLPISRGSVRRRR